MESKVMIAGAGMAAALPGMCVQHYLPFQLLVYLFPGKESGWNGCSVLNHADAARGFRFATVAIDGAKNAAILAAKILAASDEELLNKLKAYSRAEREAVKAKAAKA